MKNNSPIYVIPKKIHTPAPWGTFVLDPPLPWNFHSRGCWSYPPPTPWNFRNFPTWLGTPWKEYFRKKCLCPILLCER